MRLSRVAVKNYRSMLDFEVHLADYTVLIGPNGAGKSSLLYALDWFFNGTLPSPSDAHVVSNGSTAGDGSDSSGLDTPEPQVIEVEVEFSDLSAGDRAALGRYGSSTIATFRRIFDTGSGQDKLIGRARQGPGFAAIRSAGPVQEKKELYEALQSDVSGLASARTKDAIDKALDDWEAANPGGLVEAEEECSTHLFGFAGEAKIGKLMRFVLVPASVDMSQQIASPTKGNMLADLLGGAFRTAAKPVVDKWKADHKSDLDALDKGVATELRGAVAATERAVNEVLGAYLPKASIVFRAESQPWEPKLEPQISTTLKLGKTARDIQKQGHGVQRAVVLALLQARTMMLAGEVGTDDGPQVIVAIEEPEVFQHPIRARHFSRVLRELSATPQTQVLAATHSPYFLEPDQFESIRRITLRDERSQLNATTLLRVGVLSERTDQQIRKALQREIARSASEAFFAEAVVLVEGATDKAVIEAIAFARSTPLDEHGIEVVDCGGSGSAHLLYCILTELGIPTYVVLDADRDGAPRKYPNDEAKRLDAEGSHRNKLDGILRWLPIDQGKSFSWGDQSTVWTQCALFGDDLSRTRTLARLRTSASGCRSATPSKERAGLSLRNVGN